MRSEPPLLERLEKLMGDVDPMGGSKSKDRKQASPLRKDSFPAKTKTKKEKKWVFPHVAVTPVGALGQAIALRSTGPLRILLKVGFVVSQGLNRK